MKPKIYDSKAWLTRRYVVDKMTEEEIAKAAGTSQPTIHRALIKYNLKKKR